jgi:hypothetical protein
MAPHLGFASSLQDPKRSHRSQTGLRDQNWPILTTPSGFERLRKQLGQVTPHRRVMGGQPRRRARHDDPA